MFHEQVRKLIERQCRLLRDETNRLGRILAEADPDNRACRSLDVGAARDACARLLHGADALGLDAVQDRGHALDRALADLENVGAIRCWHMVDVMTLHADLANAVDEVEAEDTALFAGCSAPQARAVAPPPAFV